MGMYERIINNKKKEEEQFEQDSKYERITGEKNSSSNSALLNYNKQKRVLESAQKRYRTELNKEYEKQGVFNFSLPTSNRNNISLIDKLTSSQNNYTEQKLTTNPFTPKENLKKIKTAQDNVSELKNVVDEEYNKLKYVNYLKNVEKVQNEDTTLWDKTGGVIQRAITDLASSLGTDKYTYTDENGNKVHLPNYSELKQEKVSNDYNTGIGKFIFNDVLYNTSKILGSTAINTLAPGVGTFTYWQDMFMDNYKNTINQGYDNTKALAYSSVNTAFEYITGKFLGSATKGLTGGKTSELSNMVSNVTNRIINNHKISSVIGNMGSEAAEEFLQEYLDNASRLLVLGEDIDLTSSDILEDALYSAAVGGLSGGLIGSIDNSSSNNAKNNIKVYTEFKKALEETKSKTTDVNKVNEIDNLIKKVDNYIKNPFTGKSITNEVEPVLNTLKKQTTNQEVNAPTLNQNINPLENLKEFNQKQQEIKNQQFQKETTSRISELQNQVEELQESSFNLDKNAIQYNDLQQSQNIEFSKNSTGDIKVILKDANGNIVNDFTLISEKQVTKSLGTDIGNYIINNANNEVQSINISQNEQANKQPTTFKEKQLDIINKTNPMNDEYHVGIRNIDDIKTFDEVINDEESFVWGDYTKEDALRDLQKGTVTVYSSYPIENGAFVSTSKIQAQEYAGGQGSKVYSKTVPLNEIAWINGDEGQYAKVKEKIPTYKDFQQKVNLPTVNQNNVNEKINNHVVSEETINKYENATGTIDRNTLLEVADTLDIHYKEGATIIIDENMIKKAGNNKNPQIIDVSMFNRIGDLSQLTREVNNLSRDLYANNENGYTLVDNIDTNTNFELGRLGIDKTFSKNVPIEKLPTFNKLKEIGEQGLYYRTTYNSNENDGILYHHFLTPVKAINTDGNAFIRTVIKEYTKDNNMNNKFYYHQMEYLDNQKGTTDTSHIGTRTFGNSLYDNNTTNLTKSQIAPLPSQYSMQQNVENDTKIPSSKEFIPKNPTKESTYDDFKEEKQNNNENKTAQLLDKRPSTAKPTLQDSAYKTIRELVDKGEAISRLAKKSGNKELYAKYDHMGTAEAEGNYAIAIAQTDNNGNKIGKSIMEIWKPVEDANLVEEFSNYLLHKHNISRWQQGKPVFGEEVTSDISKKFVEESEKKYPQFTEWSKDINTYNKNQMQNMVDAGLTSKESQEYLNSTYDNYVRIYRDVRGNSPITQFRGNLKVNVPIKKAKGGNQDILPLKDSMAQQTIETKKAIRRNEFGLELLNVLNNGENVEYDGKQQVVKNDDGTYSFTIFKDGQPIKMEIDEGIYEALEPNKTYNFEKTLPFRAIQKVSQIQRGLLTDKNPLFIATNFFKDIGDAPFNSKYASKFVKNYVVAANEIKNNGELWNKYRALGGEQNTYFDYESGVKLPSNSKASKFIRKIQSINQIVEQLPRFTEFISTLEAGGTEAQAMYNAAEITTNFKRGGDTAKALNRNGANFLNASIQGFDKQIRNFSGQNGVKGYVNLLAKATILGILPSVLNHLLLDDDEDYQELPDYVKDSYFLFKTGDGKFIRIPKGRVVSTFGMTARRTLEYADGEKDAFDGLLNQISNQVAPNNPLEDNVFVPFLAIKNNRSWNGSEIVPQRLQNELSENQYDEKTDAISKFIGKTFKVSPKKVNYLLDQYTGGIGDVILPMLSPEANQNPISAKFTTDSVMNNKYVSEFYDTKDKLTKQSNSLKATDEDILKTKYINSMGSKMNNLYKEKREIQNSNLSNKEKLLKVKEVQQRINDIAKFSLEDYENVYIDGNYGTVGELDFYKGTNGEWTKATNDLIEKQNNISTKYDITASEFYNNREEYTYAYNNPEKYSVIKQITSFDKYNTYKEKIDDIRANTKNDKTEIIKYINSLNLSIPQKAMFIKMYYPSFNNYNIQIVNYVKQNTKTVEERTQILTKLGFTIKNGRVYW